MYYSLNVSAWRVMLRVVNLMVHKFAGDRRLRTVHFGGTTLECWNHLLHHLVEEDVSQLGVEEGTKLEGYLKREEKLELAAEFNIVYVRCDSLEISQYKIQHIKCCLVKLRIRNTCSETVQAIHHNCWASIWQATSGLWVFWKFNFSSFRRKRLQF